MLKKHVCKKRSENLRRIPAKLLYGVLGGYDLFIQEQGNEKKEARSWEFYHSYGGNDTPVQSI